MSSLSTAITASQSSANLPKYVWVSWSLLHGVTDLIETFVTVVLYLYYFPTGAAIHVTKLTRKLSFPFAFGDWRLKKEQRSKGRDCFLAEGQCYHFLSVKSLCFW